MTTVAFLVTVGIMQFPRSTDVAVVLSDVTRHEKTLQQLVDTANVMSANISVLTRIVNDHLIWDKPVSQEELRNYRGLIPLTPEEKAALMLKSPPIQPPATK